uniref:Uncharacterized protein n=1 Tax=Cannabis sativa TaxID=3483 RepID=A0A803NT54_CANSA
METSMSGCEIQSSNTLLAQIESNPMENVKTITNQSGSQLESPPRQKVYDLIPNRGVNNSSLERSSPLEANELVTSSDSYIIEREDEDDPYRTSTLFGIPFLLTASKKLDMKT